MSAFMVHVHFKRHPGCDSDVGTMLTVLPHPSVCRFTPRPELKPDELDIRLRCDTIRCGLLFNAVSGFLLHPIFSFIHSPCNPLPSGFATLPSFRPFLH